MQPGRRPLATGLNRLRCRWLEGRLHLDLDELDEAEAALEEAYHGFVPANVARETADAALDLCLVYLRQGRPQPLAGLVQATRAIFFSLDLPVDVLQDLAVLVGQAKKLDVSVRQLETLRRKMDRHGARG